MRFGTGETNITNLALPPTPNQEKATIGSKEDWTHLEAALRNYHIDEATTTYHLAAKVFFPLEYARSQSDSLDDSWVLFQSVAAELKKACRGVETDWQGWDKYIHYLSQLALMDHSRTREILISDTDWKDIGSRLNSLEGKSRWSLLLLYARAVVLVDPFKVKRNWVSENVWDQGVRIANGHKQSLGDFLTAKRLSELLASMRCLFPDRYRTAIKPTPEEQSVMLDTINAAYLTENDRLYFWTKLNFAMAVADSIFTTNDGLKLRMGTAPAAQKSELPSVPEKRSF